MKPNKINNN